jgi:hypothetical protein
MAHITSIGAGLFSGLAVANPSSAPTFANLDTQSEFDALFATENSTPGVNTFVRFSEVREYPPIGTPPNIVNVPTYGQKTSKQIQGQSDAPSMEITVNFVPSEWATGTQLGGMVGDGLQHVFRFCLLNTEPTGTGATKYASISAGLGTVPNSCWYWIGKIEALQVNPQLTDANTATVTISVQSAFYGAYTVAAA